MVVERGGVRKCFCNINVKKLVRFFPPQMMFNIIAMFVVIGA